MKSSKPVNPVQHTNGKAVWTHIPGDKYLVTGVDCSGRRFRLVLGTWQHADGINLWRGTKWLLRNGKKHKISTTTN